MGSSGVSCWGLPAPTPPFSWWSESHPVCTLFAPVKSSSAVVTCCMSACSDEIGLSLSIPVISAGSFGLSCNYKAKLTRILPPARKISDLLIHFVDEVLPFKPKWKKAYVYRKPVEETTEDCFW